MKPECNINWSNIERLISLLKRIPDENFSLLHWTYGDFKNAFGESIRLSKNALFPHVCSNLYEVVEKQNHTCGTTACVGGYAAYLATGGNPVPNKTIRTIACDFLGLSHNQAQLLFHGAWNKKGMANGRKDVITFLEKCLENQEMPGLFN